MLYGDMIPQLKELWKPQPATAGKGLYALGLFLAREFKQEGVDQLEAEHASLLMSDVIKKQNHSGGSFMVVIQKFLAVWGHDTVRLKDIEEIVKEVD